jgi:CxxC motif-containing protein (DUF1111 family)
MRWLALAAVLAACGDNESGEDRLGGDTTVVDRTSFAFTHPAANLTADQVDIWRLGKGPFDFVWAEPQLGPLFNNAACAGCHASRGRGRSQLGTDSVGSQSLIRISVNEGTPGAPGGPIPDPVYGLQLQDHSTSGLAEFFGDLAWREVPETFGDGETIMLRSPFITIQWRLGPPAGAMLSYRQAPPIIGLGLLDAIDDGTLEALADADDADGDGISGRINHVWDGERGATVTGKFGWKANNPTVRAQVAGAFDNDMGLSSKLAPDPQNQRDVSDDQLEQTIFFTSALAVPAAAPRSDAAWRGRHLFDTFGCSSCHVPTLVTGDSPTPAFAHQTIHPFTDLLVHDMGDLLSDARADFEASGTEWRTPPLWGVGLAQTIDEGVTFMHDGRARTLAEAILWHGGEAQGSRELFRMAKRADRDALLAFLATL